MATDTTDAVRAVKLGDLPKLTKAQMGRLCDIGTIPFARSYGIAPATNKRLEELGLIRPRGGKVAKTGRVMWHADAVLTVAGERILAGFPGPEFDRFRDALAKEPTPRAPSTTRRRP